MAILPQGFEFIQWF